MTLTLLSNIKKSCKKYDKCTLAIFNFDATIAKKCKRKCPVKSYISSADAFNNTLEGK